MSSVMQPLRDEHRELLPSIEAMRTAAEAAVRGEPGARTQAEKALAFLDDHLHPHATAEEVVLYPEVAKALGAPEATKTMSRDHTAVAELREELRALLVKGDDTVGIARVLFGLYTLVGVHFAKEEEVYVPILERTFNAGQAKAMYERLEAAAGEARHHHH
jgi:iron-sulfur cluster repair protein YtfE (RIC family)